MPIIGIDPGLDGAIAVIYDSGFSVVYPMPIVTIGDIKKGKNCREIDTKALYSIIKRVTFTYRKDTKIVIEKVGARSGQCSVSMLNFGKGYGMIRAVAELLCSKVIWVHPASWKSSLFGKGKHDKEDSIALAKKLYPKSNLRKTERCTTDDDNMAEALLIAEYGKRTLGGK